MTCGMKFSVILPVVQVFVAIVLLKWGQSITSPHQLDTIYIATPTLVCLGINAPATLFKLGDFLTPQPWRTTSVSGISSEEIWFLVGVAVIWFLAGIALDRGASALDKTHKVTAPRIIVNVALLLIAIVLLLLGSQHLHPNEWNNPASWLVGVLFIAWSLALGLISVRNCTRLFKRSVPSSA